MPGGISDYARQWAVAMAALPEAPEVTVVSHARGRSEPPVVLRTVQSDPVGLDLAELEAAIDESRPDVVLVHYEPHCFTRRTPCFAFNRFISRLGRRVPVVTLAHELYYSRREGLRHQPVGMLQRLALLPLFRGSTRIVLTVPDRVTRMKTVFPFWAERFAQLPVGANLIADPNTDVAGFRTRHGVPEGALLAVFLGFVHPSKDIATVKATLAHWRAEGLEARLLVVGGGQLDDPWAINAGYLSAEEASQALAASDLALLPLRDGASARRTSVINMLAAGLPVVSTLGVNTDLRYFPGSAIRLVPADDPQAFITAATALARDPAARRTLGEGARQWHDETFAWPVLARRWWDLLASTRAVAP